MSQEHERDSPKVNVWAGMVRHQIIGLFFFKEETIRQDDFLDMMINFAYPQLRYATQYDFSTQRRTCSSGTENAQFCKH